MKYQIRHTTVYRYAEPLRHSVHELRLTPRSGPLQQVDSWQIHAPGNLTRATDGFGNVVHHFTLGNRTADVTIDARGIVEAFPAGTPGSHRFVDAPGEGRYRVSPLYFLSSTPLTAAPPEMVAFAREHGLVPGDAGSALKLARAIAQRVRYKPNATDVGTTAAEAFNLGAGVCQDQAQVMVACCRVLGVPARYVSGYFHAVGEEDLASHAWADVCLDAETHTWCSIDVTHQCFTDARHIRLAVGRDYQSAAPIRGIRQGGGAETLDVSISIEPLPADAA
ncbi:MAG: transglutaminase family protein [Burkholderiaceae bacterium]|nr:transglutaminase family protein [Burkholderiaceae bacterium]